MVLSCLLQLRMNNILHTFKYLIPKFTEQTGITVTMDELGYVDLYQKIVADFVAHTAQYDLMTTDIVWSGQFAANKNTLDLTDLIATRQGCPQTG